MRGVTAVCPSHQSWGRVLDGLCSTANGRDAATWREAGDVHVVSRIEPEETCTSSAHVNSTSAIPTTSSSSFSSFSSASSSGFRVSYLPSTSRSSPSSLSPCMRLAARSSCSSLPSPSSQRCSSRASSFTGKRAADPLIDRHRWWKRHGGTPHEMEHGWARKPSLTALSGVVVVDWTEIAAGAMFGEPLLSHSVVEGAGAVIHIPIPTPTVCRAREKSAEGGEPNDGIRLLFSSSASSSPSSSSACCCTPPPGTPSLGRSELRRSRCYGGRGGQRRRSSRLPLSLAGSIGACGLLTGNPFGRQAVRAVEASWWWWCCSPSRRSLLVAVEAIGPGPDGTPEGSPGEKSSGKRCPEDKATDFRAIAEGQAKWAADQLITVNNGQFDSNLTSLGVCSRVFYSLGMYGGLALIGNVLCMVGGVDFWGGFDFNPDDFLTGLLYAAPLVALQYVMRQEVVVRIWPVARALKNGLDDEIADYFAGMSMPQFILVVVASSTAEEFFFRSAVQGGISHALQVTGRGVTETTYGMAALTGIIPPFGPLFPVVAAGIAAAITGTMYYALSTPEDPKYVIAPVRNGKHNTRREVKKQVKDWCRRRQLQKIYSPILEAMLSLYLGLEWLQTGNLLAPVITHGLFQVIMIGDGIRLKKSDNERRDRKADEQVLDFLGERRQQLQQQMAEMNDMSSEKSKK